jgi:hypothetical protein
MTALADSKLPASSTIVQWLDPNDFARWDRFVDHHPLGLIYHTSGWRNALEHSFPHMKGRFLALADPGNGEIKAGLALFEVKSWLLGSRLVSIPLASLGDFLLDKTEDFARVVPFLFDRNANSSLRTIEARAVQSPHLLTGFGFQVASVMKHHYIELDRPIDQLFYSFSRTAIRRMIAKATKEGLIVRAANSESELLAFYDLFVQTRRRLHLPPIPFRFFAALWKQFHPHNLSLLLAWRGSQLIGGVIALKYKGHYLLEYSGEIPGTHRLGVNQLLYWQAIKNASAEGYKIFSFGRTGLENTGLLEYKRHWGTVEEDLPILVHTANGSAPNSSTQASVQYRLARLLAARLPMPLFHLMGRFCYSHWG